MKQSLRSWKVSGWRGPSWLVKMMAPFLFLHVNCIKRYTHLWIVFSQERKLFGKQSYVIHRKTSLVLETVMIYFFSLVFCRTNITINWSINSHLKDLPFPKCLATWRPIARSLILKIIPSHRQHLIRYFFVKIKIKNNLVQHGIQHHEKILLSSFYLNGHT